MSIEERFRPYAAAYLVLIKNDEVLLLKRYNTGYQDGNYSLVSGHFDGGETAGQCIAREAREEANIIITPEDSEVVHVLHRFRPDREYFDVYLKVKKWAGEITNLEPNKCSELKWFKLNALPENMAPEVKQALNKINGNIFFSELGWDD
ncbi:MAG: NUDIX domain-containing protein [Candidatus Falkowbacteria bacterium]|nr:MAG: NUDIX domain-containing protein [Candidatus Falkowbacteria bacterium]